MKILLVHASAGAGHQMAAQAVYDKLLKTNESDVLLIDALDYSSAFFKTTYRETYKFLITKIPGLWGFFFALLDIDALQPFVRVLRRVQNGIQTRKLHKFLIEQQYDVVISSHFMPNEVLSALKRKGKISSKLISIVTDYDVHRIWLADQIDAYCVACAWTKEKICKIGVPEEKVHVTGIPANEKFTHLPSKQSLRKDIGIDEKAFTVLIATGSFGIGPIEEIANILDGVQVLVVCGHNKDLYARLSKHHKKNIHVFGLVDNMNELMGASNVMITKPGGLSITEAMVVGLPLVFFNAIPGQEANNVKVLNTFGVGIMTSSTADIKAHIDELKDDPKLYQDNVEKLKDLASPKAVDKIAQLVQ